MMPYHKTDNFRAWLADLTDAEVIEFAAKLEIPFLLELADDRAKWCESTVSASGK